MRDHEHRAIFISEPINPAGDNAQTTDSALRDKAVDLLKSLASQISILQSAENRARLGSNIVESLWNDDEKRARTLLISVEDDINAGLRNPEDDDRTDASRTMVFLQLRMNTVERIAKHDADLALAFLKATELRSDRLQPYREAELERALELRLAKQIAADNPEMALKLGRQSLARGFSDDLLSLLTRLQRKHKEQALLLFGDVVAKLRDADLARDPNAMYFALRLAHSFTLPPSDDATFRDFISMLITSALANGCGNKIEGQNQRSWFCRQLGSLQPQMEKVDPMRAATLKQWAPESTAPVWSPEAYGELNDVAQDGTVDEILALAAKYPQIAYDVYWRAMVKADEQDNAGANRNAIGTAFSNHEIPLGTGAMLAPVAALAGAAPSPAAPSTSIPRSRNSAVNSAAAAVAGAAAAM